jgi:hypothetical protein
MVTDEMVEKAADEMARQDITFANCDMTWQRRTIRAALEAALSAAEPQPASSVAVKALADAYKAGFDASSQGYNGEVFPEYEADNEWLAQRDSDLSTLSAQVQDVAGNPIGYMRKQDNDGNSFWVHRVQNAYYSEPVYAAAPAKQGDN